MSFDFFGLEEPEKKKRARIPSDIKRAVIARSGLKCERCGKKMKKGIWHFHHKDGNPSHNTVSNIILICPNCHAELHHKERLRKASKKTKKKEEKGLFDIDLGFGKPRRRRKELFDLW